MNCSQVTKFSSWISPFVLVCCLISGAHGGIVLQGFTAASSTAGNGLPTIIGHTIDGSGLFPSNIPQYPFEAPTNTASHDEINGSNAWLYYDSSSPNALPIGGVDVELDLGGTSYVDAIGFWNANKGDAWRSNLANYIDSQYYGVTGVQTADLYYWDLNSSAWVIIESLNFLQESGVTSTMQFEDFTPVQTTKLKLTLLSNFGKTLDENGVNLEDWIGFAEVAYRQYIPPAPPVVPEPGSVAVFGGLMAVGGLMRWRRRRSSTR
jgi:hypothetical protein